MNAATTNSLASPIRNPIMLGMAWMLASVASFTAMNIAVKFLGHGYDVMQIIFFRCLFALVPLLPLVWLTPQKYRWNPKQWRPYAWRISMGVISMLCFFKSVTSLPLAAATALQASGPLFTVVAARLFLDEKFGRAQGIALLAGFGGVLCITLPTLLGAQGAQDLDPWGVLTGLAGGLTYGLAMLGLRELGQTESSSKIVLYFSAVGTAVIAPTLPLVWVMPANGLDWALLCSSGVLAMLGQLALTRAYAIAPAAAIAPVKYTDVVLSAVVAWAIWTEIPSPNVLAGASIIIGANLLLAAWQWHRGHRKREKSTLNK